MVKSLKILLLEDNPADAEMVKRLLQKKIPTCEFYFSKDRPTFSMALDEFMPDVILSDHALPQFNSVDALTMARQQYPGIPFIMVTGSVSEEFAVEIIKQGADDYILKDRMNRLPAAIHTVLEQRRVLKEITDYKYALDQSAIVSITDHKGIITYANDNFCKMSKYSPAELIGHDHRLINSGHHSAAYVSLLWSTIASGSIWRGEFCNQAKDGSVYWVDSTITPFLNSKNTPYQYLSISIDITEKKKAAEALRHSEIRLNEAQAIAHIGNWEIDLEKDTHTWSDELYRIFGLARGEVVLSTELFLSFIHPDDAPFARQLINEVLTSFNESRLNFRFINKAGNMRHANMEWRFEFKADGTPLRLFGILQDITERKEAEESLKLLEQKIVEQKIHEQKKVAQAIITGQEREKNHIGQEMHDNINQILAGSKMYLSSAGKKNKELYEMIKYPMELIDTSINEIRLLCQKLITPQKNINLQELVDELLMMLRQNTKTKTDFICEVDAEMLNDDIKLNIYRIIQEQVNNILKYAEAKHVGISLKMQNDHIQVVIADDGKGFDPTAKRKGIGISNMINRVESFEGSVEIRTNPGEGCTINIFIPCAEQ